MNRIQFVAAIFLCVAISGMAQNSTPHSAPAKEKVVKGHATGTFEVKMTPQTAEEGTDPGIARMLLDKQIHGDLEGTSKGQMLATGSAQSSGAYVALERITGTLKGRAGSFALQHNATMTHGTPQMTITVVPDSGTGQLSGLAGTFTIKIDKGKHSYDFDYTLPEAP
jgi:hypothetical protein